MKNQAIHSNADPGPKIFRVLRKYKFRVRMFLRNFLCRDLAASTRRPHIQRFRNDQFDASAFLVLHDTHMNQLVPLDEQSPKVVPSYTLYMPYYGAPGKYEGEGTLTEAALPNGNKQTCVAFDVAGS